MKVLLYILVFVVAVYGIDLREEQCQAIANIMKYDPRLLQSYLTGIGSYQERSLNLARCQRFGMHLLPDAVSQSSVETVKVLLHACDEATLQSTNKDGENAVQLVVVRSVQSEQDAEVSLKILDLLLAANISVNHKSNNGNTALLRACADKNIEIVRRLLPHIKPAILNHRIQVNGGKANALMLSAVNNSTEIVKLLLAQPGINVFLKINDETNLLQCLIAKGCNEATFKVIVDYFATLPANEQFKKHVISAIKAADRRDNWMAADMLRQMLNDLGYYYDRETIKQIEGAPPAYQTLGRRNEQEEEALPKYEDLPPRYQSSFHYSRLIRQRSH